MLNHINLEVQFFEQFIDELETGLADLAPTAENRQDIEVSIDFLKSASYSLLLFHDLR